MYPLAHFTGVLYICITWVLFLPVYSYGFPKTSNIKQAEVKHPRFLFPNQNNPARGVGRMVMKYEPANNTL